MDQKEISYPRWKVGDKIEAKDFMNVWYPSKVVDYNSKEDKILVHFEGWNQRFDEWFPSNSEKVRPLMMHKQSQKESLKISSTQFLKVGQYVLAPWKDGENYPGKIRSIDYKQRKYEVSFLDGVTRKVLFRKIHIMPDDEIKELNFNLGTSDTFSMSTDTNCTLDGDGYGYSDQALLQNKQSDEPITKVPRMLSTCSVESLGSYSSNLCLPDEKVESREQIDECSHLHFKNYQKVFQTLNANYKYLPRLNYEDLSSCKSLDVINSIYNLQKMLKNSGKKVKLVQSKLRNNKQDNNVKIYSECEVIKRDQGVIEDALNKIETFMDGFSENFGELE